MSALRRKNTFSIDCTALGGWGKLMFTAEAYERVYAETEYRAA
jgi:hypothetical protein